MPFQHAGSGAAVNTRSTALYIDLLPFLRCPSCHNKLAARLFEIDRSGEVIAGTLTCRACDEAYPIRGGIADFLGAPRPPTPTQVINELPPAAWVYERFWRPFALTLLSGGPFSYRRELPLVARLMAPQRGGLYVDVACSNGLYARAITRAMSGAEGHAVGVDHSFPMLADARGRARQAGLRASYLRAKAQSLPLASGAAAGVAVGGSLNEIGDLDRCLAEARRLLAADGRFVAMTLVRARTALGSAVQKLFGPGGVVFWTPDELIGQFTRHGFQTLERQQYGIVLFTRSVVSDQEPRTDNPYGPPGS